MKKIIVTWQCVETFAGRDNVEILFIPQDLVAAIIGLSFLLVGLFLMVLEAFSH